MKTLSTHFPLLLLWLPIFSFSQNLPSLLTDKNINATFSILAYDEKAQEWGIAVATNNIYVGNSTIYIAPGVGAFSVIAETEPKYGNEGLQKLSVGKTIKQALLEVKQADGMAHLRQVSGIDAQGNVFAFTGNALKYWKGNASQILGNNYVVMGNQLAPNVLSSMSKTFEIAQGTLAQRLLESLVAGQKAGGQISGKQSAAVVVKGSNNEWYNQIDLRVDNAKDPIQELKILMGYHYGRIWLNQALYAYRGGNKARAEQKLAAAEAHLAGWDGIYPRIAGVHLVMGNERAAITWIKRGLAENPNWKVYLPAFYMLKDHPEMASIIQPSAFSTSDWESALEMLSRLGREIEIITKGHDLIQNEQVSPQLFYIIGRSHYYEKEPKKAIANLKKALQMDINHLEAKLLLQKISGQ